MAHASISPIANLRLALIPTALMVLFLFYIDEGWYSFKWMLDLGNWLVFCIYMIIFIPIFWIMTRYMFRRHAGLKKALFISVFGIPALCIVLLILLNFIY